MPASAFALGREAGQDGRFARQRSAFRGWVERLEPGRCHLYAARACPWAHRTLIVRKLKGLADALPVARLAAGRRRDLLTATADDVFARVRASGPCPSMPRRRCTTR